MEEETNVPTQEIVVEKTSSVGRIVLIILGFVVIFAAGIAIGVYFSFERSESESTVMEDQTVTEPVVEVDDNIVVDDDFEPVTYDDPNTLKIDWLPIEDQYQTDSDYRLVNILYEDISAQELSGVGAGPRTYVLGIVEGGKYDGYQVQQFMAGFTGMGTYVNFMYLLVDESEYPYDTVVLDKYMNRVADIFTGPTSYETPGDLFYTDEWEEIQDVIAVDSGVTILELEQMETVKDTNGVDLVSEGVWFRVDYPDKFNETDYKVITTTANGQDLRVYSNVDETEPGFARENAFFYVRNDGRVEVLSINIPFFPVGSSSYENVPLITWNDGTINQTGYLSHEIGGCGYSDQYKVVVDSSIVGNLIKAGTWSEIGSSETVYEPADLDTEYYREYFDTWAAVGREDMTWENFVANHPFFYWQDSYGRWLEFMSVDVMPAVECGKPVIYLYPEEKMEIGVEIKLEKMSYSEPEYKDGWRVIAYPDGTLVELESGEEYPYLFWEGLGDSYVSPENYWVVAREEVEPFLVQTLTRLGLNEQEIADFNEFWLPRMEAASYYQIGFHGTEVMNQIAPLTLTEKPDSVLRILMDYHELEQPIKANPPNFLPTFERNGFSLIEWGGVLR